MIGLRRSSHDARISTQKRRLHHLGGEEEGRLLVVIVTFVVDILRLIDTHWNKLFQCPYAVRAFWSRP